MEHDRDVLHRRGGIIDNATFELRRTERRHFQVRVKEQPDANGKARIICPAYGPSPSVTCPLVEMQANASSKPQRPHAEEPPEFPDDICRKAHGITVDTTPLIRDQQAFEFGSPEWETFHRHARQTIESTNAQLKDTTGTDLEQARRRPARGFAAAAFFSTILITTFNISKIAAFLHDLKHGAPTTAKPTRSRPRDSRWYNGYTGTTPRGLAPPSYITERFASRAQGGSGKRAKTIDGALPTVT